MSATLTCPDCTAVDERDLRHDDTCPAFRGVERVCADDARWFAAHPAAGWRWRDGTAAERAELAAGGIDLTGLYVRVHVVDLGHGRHLRYLVANGALVLYALDIPPALGWSQ